MCFMLLTIGVPVLLVKNGELQTYVPPGKLCEGVFKSRERAEEAGRKKTKHGGTFEVVESSAMLNSGD